LQELLARVPELQGYQVTSKMKLEKDQTLFYLEKGDKMGYIVMDPLMGTPQFISFDLENRNRAEQSTKRPDDATVTKTAERFVQNVLGTKENAYRAYKNMRGENRISLYRYVNGVRFTQDFVTIKTNHAGEIISGNFERNGIYEESDFPVPSGIMEKNAAEQILYSRFGLQYINRFVEQAESQTGEPKKARPLITYSPFIGSPTHGQIDARTGAFISVSDVKRVSVQPPRANPALHTVEGAASFIQDYGGMNLSQSKVGVDEDDDKIRYIWKRDRAQLATLQVDPRSGALIHLQQNKPIATELSNSETAREIARRAVEQLLVPTSTEVYVTEGLDWDSLNATPYFYTFYESRNGLIVTDSSYFVTIYYDGRTVRDIRRRGTTPGQLTDPKGVVSPEQAFKAYLHAHPLELIYTIKEKGGKPTLVYQPAGESNVHIDAVTGHEIREAEPSYGEESQY
jgi:hypothetical protein